MAGTTYPDRANGAPSQPDLTRQVLAAGRAAGLARVGVAAATILEPARSTLQIRKAAGLAGDMQFTYRNPARSTDPETVLAGARSLVAGAWAYGQWRQPDPPPDAARPHGAVARYSWHDHYGDLEAALQPMADLLTARGFAARVVADTNALVDRNVAWRAGIGWYGKNSNLLIPGAGSWFVLGAVVTDAELAPTGPPVVDGCGPCNRCMEDCPTGAIVAPGVVDATRCLAWIVQAPGAIPIGYREAIGDRIYGCDDCQDVCPPNRSAAEADDGPTAEANRVRADIIWLLGATDDEILERHGRWYIPRRDVDHLRRTALVVLGNTAEPTDRAAGSWIVEVVDRYLAHPNPMLRAHATWTAKRLGLGDRLPEEDDPEVKAEQRAVVTARHERGQWSTGYTEPTGDGR